MSRIAARICLTEEERRELESWVQDGTVERRMVQRARIVLESGAGKTTREVARSLMLRAATVSKWRIRFSRAGIAGLVDEPRPGKMAKYDETTERRILDQVDASPPAGCITWTGRLVAEALGDVSPHHVWRVLRRHGIQLQGRSGCCNQSNWMSLSEGQPS